MRNRLVVVIGALGALVFCWQQLLPRLGQELIPQVHQGEFNMRVALPVGTPLEKTASVVERIETVASNQPEVERMATTVGTPINRPVVPLTRENIPLRSRSS